MNLEMQFWANNPILRHKSEYITNINKQTREIVKYMEAELKSQDGMWLAAPQVWLNIRLAIITQRDVIKGKYIYKSSKTIINPTIIKHSETTNDDREWCLSLPWNIWLISRYDWVELSYQDIYGKNKTAKLKWVDARIAQHELDHLEGILYIDKAKKIKPA